MLAGCTHLLVTAVPSTLRINTPSAWSKPQHDAVHRQGRTPEAVARFNSFDEDNDPYGEHAFGALEIEGERLFFKIDYYDQSLSAHSPDPADESVTKRVLTIMLAEEY
jgi:hypothetical protein